MSMTLRSSALWSAVVSAQAMYDFSPLPVFLAIFSISSASSRAPANGAL